MRDFDLLAEDAGARKPKVLPIPSAADPTEFPGTVSAEAGVLMLAMRREASEGAEDFEFELDTERLAAVEDDLLGAGAARLDELGIFGEWRMHVIATLMVWHLVGYEAAEEFWDAGPGGPGKARQPSSRATSPKTAGRSSKGASSQRSPRTAQRSTSRTGGDSSSSSAARRARA